MPPSPQTPARVFRRRRRVAAALFAALLAGSVTVTVLGGSAPAQDAMAELESKMNELEGLQAQEGPLRETIDRQNAEVDALIGRESELRVQEDAAQEKLDQAQAKLDRATAQLEAQQARLAEVQARLQRALDHLSEMLVEIYKSGTPDTLSVVLNSASFEDVIGEAEYLDRIQNYDDATIARVEDLRSQVAEAVEQMTAVRAEIKSSRDEIAAQRDALTKARSQVTEQHQELVAARQSRQATLEQLLAREKTLQKDIIPSSVPPGGKAALVGGEAVAPPNAPLAVKAALEAGNQINDKPYLWGGGHGSFDSPGYDCSGAMSFIFNAGGLLDTPLDSTGFMSWGLPGGGSWITAYGTAGHAYAVVAGLRWDTAGTGSSGPRWSTDPVSPVGSPASFVARHPPGL